MPLLAGACVITPARVVTGTGLAKAIADACMAPNPPGTTTESALQSFCNLLAAAIVEHITTNAAVSVTVAAPIAVQVAPVTGTGGTIAPGAGTGTVL